MRLNCELQKIEYIREKNRLRQKLYRLRNRDKILEKRRIKNMSFDKIEKRRASQRIENMNKEQILKRRASQRFENLTEEQIKNRKEKFQERKLKNFKHKDSNDIIPTSNIDTDNLFPNPPTQVLEDSEDSCSTDNFNENQIDNKTKENSNTETDKVTADKTNEKENFGINIQNKLLIRVSGKENTASCTTTTNTDSINKISIPPSSQSPYYSSSSESSSSHGVGKPKSRKRVCKKCNLYFRHRRDFLEHHKTHVSHPNIVLKRLTESEISFYDKKKTQTNTISSTTIMPSVSPSDGLKLKFKLSGTQMCEVITKKDLVDKEREKDREREKEKERANEIEKEIKEKERQERERKTRILTAREIKQSNSPPLSANVNHPTNVSENLNTTKEQNPIAAMEAIADIPVKKEHLNFPIEEPSEKMHFECPTLDGLDQFNEVGKDDAAALLKHLLETQPVPQENDWSSTNEFISIDRLAHICTICHSNFPDEMALYEHKRSTGHNFDPSQHPPTQRNQMPHLPCPRPPHMQQPPHPSQMMRQPMPMPGYGQPPVMPMEQLQQHVRNIPMHPSHHPNYNQMYGPQTPPPRRPPPPLYRVPSPNAPNSMSPQQQQQQRFNMMMNHHPQQQPQLHPNQEIFRQMGPMGNLLNGSCYPSRPNQISPPAHGQQSPQQNMMRPPNMMHRLPIKPPGPMQQNMMPPSQKPEPPKQITQICPITKRPIILQKRTSPNHTPSPPILNATISKIKNVPTINSPPLCKKSKINDDDCEVISMQPRLDGIPIIQKVQGASPDVVDANLIHKKDSIQINEQITLTSIKNKETSSGQNQMTKNPKDVANILAHRGITVTPSAGAKINQNNISNNSNNVSNNNNNSNSNSPVNNNSNNVITVSEKSNNSSNTSSQTNKPSDDASLQKLQLNSAVSIISKKKPSPSIDLTDEKGDDNERTNIDFLSCHVPGCKQKFLTHEALNKHNQKGHKLLTTKLYSCKKCTAKFSTLDGLSFHIRKVHATSKAPADEVGLPIVDLKNEETRNKLAAIGIVNYIPLGHLNQDTGGSYGVPIVSVKGASNSAICNLMAIGADSVLSIGPVKTLPSRTSTVTSPNTTTTTTTSTNEL